MSSSASETRAVSVRDVRVSDDELALDLSDGRTVTAPITWYPRLVHATSEERANFLSGGISFLSFQYADDGNKAKSQCVYKWFYESDDSTKDIMVVMLKARLTDPTLHVEALILALIDKKCGHLDKKEVAGK